MVNNELTVIKPAKGWLDTDIKGVFKKKDLIFLLVRRNFVSNYKQTILGPLWAIINPLLTTFVFSFVFGNLAGLSTDGAPTFLFYLCGNIAWGYFSTCINSTAGTFISHAHLMGKVYFPRLIMPISSVITGLINFAIQSAMLVIMLGYYLLFTNANVTLSVWILFVPVLILMIAMLGLGIGIIVSAVTTKYRDLAMLVSFGVQLWLYGTPVAYSVDLILDKAPHLFNLYMLNPMAPVITMMRYCVLGINAPGVQLSLILKYLCFSALTTVIVLFLGIMLFSRVEKNFADTV